MAERGNRSPNDEIQTIDDDDTEADKAAATREADETDSDQETCHRVLRWH